MMGHGIGTTDYYVKRDPRRQDLLRQAEQWELARQAGLGPALRPGHMVKWALNQLTVLGTRMVGLARRFRRAGQGRGRPAWS